MIDFIKAHGTENDFIVIVDPEAKVELTAEKVAALADRRAGIGADGIIRVARADALLAAGVLRELADGVEPQEWFMDYRNADGSVAEMCGNGVRVFAHVLVSEGLVAADDATPSRFGVGTRAGRKTVEVHDATERSADVSVDMGQPRVLGLSTAEVGGVNVAGLAVDMGNPHLAAVLPGLDEAGLRALPVEQPVTWDEGFFPNGVNLEVLTPLADGQVHMRVHERGVGETRSCGTGTVAAAQAALADAGQVEGDVRVHVPGGTVRVSITESTAILWGPSAIVARGTALL